MKLYAAALAFLLLVAGASAAPAACCPPGGPADLTIRSMDCCAALLECPNSQQPALMAPVRGATTAPADSLSCDSIVSAALRFPRWTISREVLGPFPGATPLYRLYAQLLI
jgi:hypothetical protein